MSSSGRVFVCRAKDPPRKSLSTVLRICGKVGSRWHSLCRNSRRCCWLVLAVERIPSRMLMQFVSRSSKHWDGAPAPVLRQNLPQVGVMSRHNPPQSQNKIRGTACRAPLTVRLTWVEANCYRHLPAPLTADPSTRTEVLARDDKSKETREDAALKRRSTRAIHYTCGFTHNARMAGL